MTDSNPNSNMPQGGCGCGGNANRDRSRPSPDRERPRAMMRPAAPGPLLLAKARGELAREPRAMPAPEQSLEPIGVIEARRERAREREAFRRGEYLEPIGVIEARRERARTREMLRTGELLPPIDAPPDWDPFYVPPQMRQLTPPGAGLLYEAPAPPPTGMRSPDRGRYF